MSYRTNRKTGGIFRVNAFGERIEMESNELNEFMAKHVYSYRDVPFGEFARLYKKYPEFGSQIRQKYRSLESGRLAASMDAFHKFVASLDRDERDLFKSRNPEIVKMMNEWAVVEDLGEF